MLGLQESKNVPSTHLSPRVQTFLRKSRHTLTSPFPFPSFPPPSSVILNCLEKFWSEIAETLLSILLRSTLFFLLTAILLSQGSDLESRWVVWLLLLVQTSKSWYHSSRGARPTASTRHLKIYNWLLDLGGGDGCLLSLVSSAYPLDVPFAFSLRWTQTFGTFTQLLLRFKGLKKGILSRTWYSLPPFPSCPFQSSAPWPVPRRSSLCRTSGRRRGGVGSWYLQCTSSVASLATWWTNFQTRPAGFVQDQLDTMSNLARVKF